MDNSAPIAVEMDKSSPIAAEMDNWTTISVSPQVMDLISVVLGFYLYNFVIYGKLPSVLPLVYLIFGTMLVALCYIVIVTVNKTLLLVLSGCFAAFYTFFRYTVGRLPPKHVLARRLPFKHVLARHLEAQIQGCLEDLERHKRKVVNDTKCLEKWIVQADAANAELQKKIRAAECRIVRKMRDFEPQPDRGRYHISGGVLVWRHPIFETPSEWAIVRFLKGQEDPRVYWAMGDCSYAEARLGTKNNAASYYQRENDLLTERLAAVEAKANSVMYRADLVRENAWGDTSEWLLRKAEAQTQTSSEMTVYQPPQGRNLSLDDIGTPAIQRELRFEAAVRDNGKMLHVCTDCGDGSGHPWIYEHPTIGDAINTPRFFPCPDYRARAADSPWFKSLTPFAQTAAPAPEPSRPSMLALPAPPPVLALPAPEPESTAPSGASIFANHSAPTPAPAAPSLASRITCGNDPEPAAPSGASVVAHDSAPTTAPAVPSLASRITYGDASSSTPEPAAPTLASIFANASLPKPAPAVPSLASRITYGNASSATPEPAAPTVASIFSNASIPTPAPALPSLASRITYGKVPEPAAPTGLAASMFANDAAPTPAPAVPYLADGMDHEPTGPSGLGASIFASAPVPGLAPAPTAPVAESAFAKSQNQARSAVLSASIQAVMSAPTAPVAATGIPPQWGRVTTTPPGTPSLAALGMMQLEKTPAVDTQSRNLYDFDSPMAGWEPNPVPAGPTMPSIFMRSSAPVPSQSLTSMIGATKVTNQTPSQAMDSMATAFMKPAPMASIFANSFGPVPQSAPAIDNRMDSTFTNSFGSVPRSAPAMDHRMDSTFTNSFGPFPRSAPAIDHRMDSTFTNSFGSVPRSAPAMDHRMEHRMDHRMDSTFKTSSAPMASFMNSSAPAPPQSLLFTMESAKAPTSAPATAMPGLRASMFANAPEPSAAHTAHAAPAAVPAITPSAAPASTPAPRLPSGQNEWPTAVFAGASSIPTPAAPSITSAPAPAQQPAPTSTAAPVSALRRRKGKGVARTFNVIPPTVPSGSSTTDTAMSDTAAPVAGPLNMVAPTASSGPSTSTDTAMSDTAAPVSAPPRRRVIAGPLNMVAPAASSGPSTSMDTSTSAPEPMMTTALAASSGASTSTDVTTSSAANPVTAPPRRRRRIAGPLNMITPTASSGPSTSTNASTSAPDPLMILATAACSEAENNANASTCAPEPMMTTALAASSGPSTSTNASTSAPDPSLVRALEEWDEAENNANASTSAPEPMMTTALAAAPDITPAASLAQQSSPVSSARFNVQGATPSTAPVTAPPRRNVVAGPLTMLAPATPFTFNTSHVAPAPVQQPHPPMPAQSQGQQPRLPFPDHPSAQEAIAVFQARQDEDEDGPSDPWATQKVKVYKTPKAKRAAEQRAAEKRAAEQAATHRAYRQRF